MWTHKRNHSQKHQPWSFLPEFGIQKWNVSLIQYNLIKNIWHAGHLAMTKTDKTRPCKAYSPVTGKKSKQEKHIKYAVHQTVLNVGEKNIKQEKGNEVLRRGNTMKWWRGHHSVTLNSPRWGLLGDYQAEKRSRHMKQKCKISEMRIRLASSWVAKKTCMAGVGLWTFEVNG